MTTDSIDKIIADFRAGKITADEAQRRLQKYRQVTHSWLERLVGA